MIRITPGSLELYGVVPIDAHDEAGIGDERNDTHQDHAGARLLQPSVPASRSSARPVWRGFRTWSERGISNTPAEEPRNSRVTEETEGREINAAILSRINILSQVLNVHMLAFSLAPYLFR